MRILVSNDDGYRAEGLQRLADALRPLADVTVVAPDRNRSGASNSLTLDQPVRVQELEPGRFRVNGTPTDCVHLALLGLLDTDPDIVVSGINFGQNFGDAVNLSGTVGAATTAARLGIPAVAVSEGIPATGYAQAADIATVFVAWVGTELVRNPPAPGYQTVTNINVPDCGRINGVVAVPIGRLRTHAGFTANGDGSFTPQFSDREFGAFDCASGATTATDDIDAYNKGLVGITQVRPLSSGL